MIMETGNKPFGQPVKNELTKEELGHTSDAKYFLMLPFRSWISQFSLIFFSICLINKNMKRLVQSNTRTVRSFFSKSLSKAIVSAAFVCLLLFITGCGNSLEGETYLDEGGTKILEFKSSDKVYVNAILQTLEVPYTIDDDKIKIEIPNQGTVILTIEEDGTITGMPMMGKLTKKED
jgi:hypothetical protein